MRLEIEDDLASTVDAALRTRLETLRAALNYSASSEALTQLRLRTISQLENLIFELRRTQAVVELNTKEKHG